MKERIAALAILGLPLLVLPVVISLALRDSEVVARPLFVAFMTDRDGNFEGYLIGADGEGLTNLTLHESIDGLLSWSPVARAFAFVSLRDSGTPRLYRMASDGTDQRLLVPDVELNVTGPVWSPAGEWISFESAVGENVDVYVVRGNGGEVRNLTDNPATDRFGDWSPGGEHILFSSDRDGSTAIYRLGLEDSDPTRLTSLEFRSILPAWSPDGRQIAFVSDRDDDVDIYVMDADGGNVTRLTDSVGVDAFPTWSPDGSQIAFLSARDGDAEIYVMKADGDGQTNLTQSPAQESTQGDFAWSPDGSQILFHSDRDGNVEVYVMDADGSSQLNLSNHPDSDLASIWVQ